MYCGSRDGFDEAQLSGRGKIYTFTEIAPGGAPPEFARQAALTGSYIVAIVELAEGPRVVAQLVDCTFSDLQVGKEVMMVVRRIYVEEGVVRYGYKFRLA